MGIKNMLGLGIGYQQIFKHGLDRERVHVRRHLKTLPTHP